MTRDPEMVHYRKLVIGFANGGPATSRAQERPYCASGRDVSENFKLTTDAKLVTCNRCSRQRHPRDAVHGSYDRGRTRLQYVVV